MFLFGESGNLGKQFFFCRILEMACQSKPWEQDCDIFGFSVDPVWASVGGDNIEFRTSNQKLQASLTGVRRANMNK